MGANGSGKSSLALTIMGHPRYQITQGQLLYKEQSITNLTPDKRAKLGIFLAFQNPYALPGVSVFTFLKESYQVVTSKVIDVSVFQELLCNAMDALLIDQSFMHRSLNDGFSGGEKKRFEMLQLLLLKPDLVILDELDSGLDIDSLKIVTTSLVRIRQEQPAMSIVIITHHQKILSHISPDFVHVLHDGMVVKTGPGSLAHEIEDKGYDGYRIS
jgi:Fe-S cluster assembly ATP-binding protein